MKRSIYVYITILALIATSVALAIGSNVAKDISTINNVALSETSNGVRKSMRDILRVTRESVMIYTNKQEINVSSQKDIQEIIDRFIVPIKVANGTDDLVLIQVSPTYKVLYQMNKHAIDKKLVDNIMHGIDSSIEDGNTFTADDEDHLIEWIGIPPGTAMFKENTKWVLAIVSESKLVEARSKNIRAAQAAILTNIYIILIISCLVALVTAIAIAILQREQYQYVSGIKK